jgi:signal transduction histidine kinase
MRFVHVPPLRVVAIIAAAIVAIATPVALGHEAWNAARRHRQAAERALADHADFAAVGYRQRVIARLFGPVGAVFRPLGNARLAHPDGPLPPLALLRQTAAEADRCVDCGPAVRPTYFFRLTLADSTIEVDGPDLSAARRAFLLGELTTLGKPDAPRDWEIASTMDTLVVGGPDVVYVTVRRGPTGAPRAVYGFAVPITALRDTFLRPVLELGSLLALPMQTAPPNDSVLAVTLLAPNGSGRLELTPRALPTRYSSTIPGSVFLGGWQLRVSLDPGRAPALLIAGLPPSRTPLLATLVLLTILLIGTTLFVAWRALELARLRENFVASVSHELRTPLAQILLFGETLSHGRVDTRREVRSSARIIVGEARRLMQLVDTVLLFGRGKRPNGSTAPLEELALAELVHETVATFAPVASATDARVRVTRADGVIVPGDRGAIRQILLNLLDNAVKYGPSGQTVAVSLTLVDEWARLTIDDEGPGVPASDRGRVWRPFVRLRRDVDAQIAGSGIGLAVVRELADRHAGRAFIEDAPNGGARIVVELPGARSPDGTSAAADQRSSDASVECAS